MPPVRSSKFSASKPSKPEGCVRLAAIILLFNKIMLLYLRYAEKGLEYVAIAALSDCQPSSCTKCTKSNMQSSYNIQSISDAEYIYLIYL